MGEKTDAKRRESDKASLSMGRTVREGEERGWKVISLLQRREEREERREGRISRDAYLATLREYSNVETKLSTHTTGLL